MIKDKYYLLEQEYKKKGIPFSPHLMYPPGGEDQSKSSEKKEDEEFDYYKRHILLESYDEEPEEPGVILQRMEELKKRDGKRPIKQNETSVKVPKITINSKETFT